METIQLTHEQVAARNQRLDAFKLAVHMRHIGVTLDARTESLSVMETAKAIIAEMEAV